MTESNDPLKEVYKNDYETLMKNLEKEFPFSLTLYGWLKSRLSWIKKDPENHGFHIFAPNGDIRNGMVFFGAIRGRTYLITIYVFNNDLSKLVPALLQSKVVKWHEATCVGINIEFTKEMEVIMEKLGYNVHTDIGSKLWMLDVETAFSYSVECPEDMYLAPLRPEDVPKVNSLWALKFEGSEENVLGYISLNKSVGLYTKKDNELICWSIESEYSEIGVLFTMPEYRKRGLAQIVVKALAKEIAKKKNFVITYTVLGNVVPEKMFEKLGFKHVCEYGFLEYDKKST